MKNYGGSLSQVRIIYVLTTAFLVALSIFTFLQIKKIFDSSSLIFQTNEVKKCLYYISVSIVDAETNKRGFLLSGDSILLFKRDAALEVVRVQQQLLDSLILDNPLQIKNFKALKLVFIEKEVSIRNTPAGYSPMQVISYFKDNTLIEVEKMDSVQLYLNRMIKAETDLLDQRTQVLKRLSFLTPIYIIVLFLGALLILFFSYFRINRELKESQNLHSIMLKQNRGKEILGEELILANQKLGFQNEEKEKRAAELTIANKELAFQNEEKEKRAEELFIANRELAFQNQEKEDRAAELIVANKELVFQNEEKEKRAEELVIANKELAFQNQEKEDRAAELILANKELAFQNEEKEKRADELVIANTELAFQNQEKENRAAELVLANRELIFQNEEKEKRAEELVIANTELAFQNQEKEDRAAELVLANRELIFQNEEKEKRAGELVLANKELAFQNQEKENRAAELILANQELAFQNEEKEKRAAELFSANKELQLFLNISSHDLQEPLRKIQMAASRIGEMDYHALSEKGKDHFVKMRDAALSMQTLIEDLLTYSRTNSGERIFENIDLNLLMDDVTTEIKEAVEEKHARIEISDIGEVSIIPFQFRQLVLNILTNALKFSIPGQTPHITIKGRFGKGKELNKEKLFPDREYFHLSISDNGIGFDPEYNEKIFEVFQRLHGKETYKGTGIGLAIVKRIVENHHGIITANSQLHKGAIFDIYIPTLHNDPYE